MSVMSLSNWNEIPLAKSLLAGLPELITFVHGQHSDLQQATSSYAILTPASALVLHDKSLGLL